MSSKDRDHLKPLESKLGVTFRKKALLRSALTHSSVGGIDASSAGNIYERLEFFGDSIINFLVCEKLFELFPNASEGILSRYRSTLVSRKILALIAQKISLQKYIHIAYADETFASDNPKLLADSLEALVGALYLDRGIAQTRQLIRRLWNPFLNKRKIFSVDPNPKSMLQEICQKHYKRLPVYEFKPVTQGFKAAVYIQKRIMGKGTGPSKQTAAEAAAHELILKLKKKNITLSSEKVNLKA